MATKFWTLLDKLYRSSVDNKYQAERARQWFRGIATTVQGLKPETIMKGNSPLGRPRLRGQSQLDRRNIGRMMLFFYDPKTKDKLPYYDKFPLVFPFRFVKDGFYGINLHYLPPVLRAKLLDAIYTGYIDKHLDEEKRLNFSYKLLNGSSRYRWFKPCVKRYLYSHVRSKYNVIDPKEWDMVCMLPVEQFVKRSSNYVWKQSRQKIGNL